MMYSEFAEAVGCKDNQHNHEVFRRLEIMYMADDSITKDEIYEYGRKLVDNTPSEEEVAIHEQIEQEIQNNKQCMEDYKSRVAMYQAFVDEAVNAEDKKYWQKELKINKSWVKHYRNRIKELRWVLG